MIKKILSFIIITSILASSVLVLSSCDKPEIYRLLDMLVNNKQDGSYYTFSAELGIVINKDYLYKTGILTNFKKVELDPVPNEIIIRFDGDLHHTINSRFCRALINIYIEEYKLAVYLQDDKLYFANNELTRIVLDLLAVSGFLDYPVKDIFSKLAYVKEGVFYIDLEDFDLTWFEQYAKQTEQTFKINSSLEMRQPTGTVPILNTTFGEDTIINFDMIKSKVKMQLLKTQGYRYTQLNIILSPDDNTLNILATRENGKRELLKPFKLDYNVAAMIKNIREESGALWTENILPMRYILELMGETVGWDDSERKPYIERKGEPAYFKASIINSRSYIDLTQILSTAYMQTRLGEIGDYLEFKIYR